MHLANAGRIACGRERLAEHLPAEYALAADVAALAAEDVVFEALELEQLEEVSKDGCHSSCSRFPRIIATDSRSGIESVGLRLNAQQDA